MSGAKFTTTAHAAVASTDKIPALKSTTKGYLTPPFFWPPGHLYGMTLSNNGSDATNDIDFAAGSCVDSTGVAPMIGSALTKQLDATWAAGTNAGGKMSAAAITNTTYHCFAIRKDSDGSVDYGFDTSPTAPTMPTGYTYFRRIGSVIRASNALVAFNQVGDEFLRLVPSQDASSATWTSTSSLVACGVPTGIKVGALVTVEYSANATIFGLVTSPDQTDTAASNLNFNMLITTDGRITTLNGAVRTNTSGQIRVNTDASTGASGFVHTRGWLDTRGRLA